MKAKPKKMSKAAARRKADKALAAARSQDLLRILLDGALPAAGHVTEYVRGQEGEEGSPWHLKPGEMPMGERQIRRYVKAALDLIADISAENRGRLLNRHLAQRRNLFARAVQTGELGTALSVLRDEATLLGLYPPTKVAPTNPEGDKPYEPLTLTDAERRAALDRLYGTVGPGAGNSAAGQQADAG
jgi:hypothetical protein